MRVLIAILAVYAVGPEVAYAQTAPSDSSRFTNIDGLVNINGIGPKTLAKLRPNVVLE